MLSYLKLKETDLIKEWESFSSIKSLGGKTWKGIKKDFSQAKTNSYGFITGLYALGWASTKTSLRSIYFVAGEAALITSNIGYNVFKKKERRNKIAVGSLKLGGVGALGYGIYKGVQEVPDLVLSALPFVPGSLGLIATAGAGSFALKKCWQYQGSKKQLKKNVHKFGAERIEPLLITPVSSQKLTENGLEANGSALTFSEIDNQKQLEYEFLMGPILDSRNKFVPRGLQFLTNFHLLMQKEKVRGAFRGGCLRRAERGYEAKFERKVANKLYQLIRDGEFEQITSFKPLQSSENEIRLRENESLFSKTENRKLPFATQARALASKAKKWTTFLPWDESRDIRLVHHVSKEFQKKLLHNDHIGVGNNNCWYSDELNNFLQNLELVSKENKNLRLAYNLCMGKLLIYSMKHAKSALQKGAVFDRLASLELPLTELKEIPQGRKALSKMGSHLVEYLHDKLVDPCSKESNKAKLIPLMAKKAVDTLRLDENKYVQYFGDCVKNGHKENLILYAAAMHEMKTSRFGKKCLKLQEEKLVSLATSSNSGKEGQTLVQACKELASTYDYYAPLAQKARTIIGGKLLQEAVSPLREEVLPIMHEYFKDGISIPHKQLGGYFTSVLTSDVSRRNKWVRGICRYVRTQSSLYTIKFNWQVKSLIQQIVIDQNKNDRGRQNVIEKIKALKEETNHNPLLRLHKSLENAYNRSIPYLKHSVLSRK